MSDIPIKSPDPVTFGSTGITYEYTEQDVMNWVDELTPDAVESLYGRLHAHILLLRYEKRRKIDNGRLAEHKRRLSKAL